MEMILQNVKVLLGLAESDRTKDNILTILVSQSMNMICIYLGVEELPTALNFIAEQMVVIRYNRLGAEGITTEKIDVLSTTYSYNIDELAPYKDVLDSYSLNNLNNGGNNYNGRFKML